MKNTLVVPPLGGISLFDKHKVIIYKKAINVFYSRSLSLKGILKKNEKLFTIRNAYYS